MEAKITNNPELCDTFTNYKELSKKSHDRKYNDFHELQANFKELQVKDKSKTKQMMSKGNRKKKRKKQKLNFEGETFKDPDPYQLAVRKTKYGNQKNKFVFEGEKFADPDPHGLAIRKSSVSSFDDKYVLDEYMSQLHHAHPGVVNGSMDNFNKDIYIGKLDYDEDNEDSSLDDAQESCYNASALAQFLAVGVKNVLLLGYGMSLGFPTIVIPAIQGGEGREPSMEEGFTLNKDEISWLSSINLICVPLGCVFSGMLSQPIGRRRAMQLVNIPVFISWILFHLAQDAHFLYCGLALSGFSGGLGEAPVLTYVAEITQPRYRGMLAASGSTFVILGVLIEFFMGSFLRWRTVALCSACVPVVSFILLFFVPESPVWLAQKNKPKRARKALAWLRGWVPEEQIEQEYTELLNHMEQTAKQQKHLSAAKKLQLYTSKPFLKPFAVISLCFFIGHFSGMTTLQTYAVQIFHTLKAPIDKYYATILLGVAELLGTLFCMGLVHYSGKRPLVFVSSIGCGICFFSVASYAYFLHMIPGPSVNNVVANVSAIKTDVRVIPLNHTEILSIGQIDSLADFVQNTTKELPYTNFNITSDTAYDNLNFNPLYVNGSYDDTVEKDIRYGEYVRTVFPRDVLVQIPNANENKYLWLPLTLLLGSAFLTHMGIRMIPWMLIGELFAPSIRSGASGISGGTGYIFGFLANKLFLRMLATLTLPGTFWMYSAITFIGTAILYKILPETEGKSLMEIEQYFSKKRKDSIHFDLDLEAPPKPKPRISISPTAIAPPPLPPRSHPLKDDLGRIRKTSHMAQTRRLSDTSNTSRKISTCSSNKSAQSYALSETPAAAIMENYRKISASKTPITPSASSDTQQPVLVVPPRLKAVKTPQIEEPSELSGTQRYKKYGKSISVIENTKRKVSNTAAPAIEVKPRKVSNSEQLPKNKRYSRSSRLGKPVTIEGFDVTTWDSNIKFEEMLRKRQEAPNYEDDADDSNFEAEPISNTSASQHDLRQLEQHVQQRDAHMMAMGIRRTRQNSGSLNMLSTGHMGQENPAFKGSKDSVDTKM
ncbi:uncharacterized protein LOC134226618 isoform X2 [Armigeres subalbatus]|uniref:uncharacterized protein LOC134226618 isoform X2 n=1 Tax=Armigeres subalbatus TaxID=124917 RepID=UPI002ED56F57